MRYLPSLVTVRDIQPRTSRAAHPEDAVEQLARHILSAGALARPLVVRPNGLETFELLDGELAYHAAARAREINPVQAEAVLAFVCTRDNEPALLGQLASLEEGQPQRAVTATTPADGLDAAMARVEHLLTQQFRRLEEHQRQENRAFRESLGELRTVIPQPPKLLRLLNGEDDAMLASYLRETGQKTDELLAGIRAKRRFISMQEAAKQVKGLTEARLLKMVDLAEGHIKLTGETSRVLQTRREAVTV